MFFYSDTFKSLCFHYVTTNANFDLDEGHKLLNTGSMRVHPSFLLEVSDVVTQKKYKWE